MSCYLREIASEADRRVYVFNASLIADLPSCRRLQATHGQLVFEWQHSEHDGNTEPRHLRFGAAERTVAFKPASG